MKYSRESASDIIGELKPLLSLHYEEIAHYKDIPLDPNFDSYLASDASGILRIFTARSNCGALVGYAIFYVRENPHYRTSVQAAQDILFIHPDFRGSGGRFILWCDEQLRKEGVQVVYQHLKAAHNFGAMLERMRYELVDLIYAKRLDQ